jgi:hypothetical protein
LRDASHHIGVNIVGLLVHTQSMFWLRSPDQQSSKWGPCSQDDRHNIAPPPGIYAIFVAWLKWLCNAAACNKSWNGTTIQAKWADVPPRCHPLCSCLLRLFLLSQAKSGKYTVYSNFEVTMAP